MKRFIIVSVLVISTTICFGQSLADKASSFLNKAFDKAISELDADSASSDVAPVPTANETPSSDVSNDTSTSDLVTTQGTPPLIPPRTGKTSKGEDFTLSFFHIEDTYVVFLDGCTDYNELVEISYQTKELPRAAFIYRQILECVADPYMPTFGDIINHVYFDGCTYYVDTYTTNDTTGLFYLIDYEDFLYFFR